MKKPFPRVIMIIISVIAGVAISSAFFVAAGISIFGRTPEKQPVSGDVSNAELTALAYGVLDYIKDGDYEALSLLAHPELGVVFSPSATVTLSTNRRFSAEQIAGFDNDSTVYIWGVFNGSGEPIEMTLDEYFAEFVFPRDYRGASVIGINRIVRTGNALENITDVFPDAKFVDFHIPGGERDPTEELDWSSLRLGFEEYDGSLWLTAIINSRWTV